MYTLLSNSRLFHHHHHHHHRHKLHHQVKVPWQQAEVHRSLLQARQEVGQNAPEVQVDQADRPDQERKEWGPGGRARWALEPEVPEELDQLKVLELEQLELVQGRRLRSVQAQQPKPVLGLILARWFECLPVRGAHFAGQFDREQLEC